MPETFIIIKDQFPAIHAWYDCPHAEVSFLRNAHRHIFYVTVKLRVVHDDRDIEFFMVKKTLTDLLHNLFANQDLGNRSCEMLCKEIKENLDLMVFKLLDIHSIQVWEDNENGAEVVF